MLWLRSGVVPRLLSRRHLDTVALVLSIAYLAFSEPVWVLPDRVMTMMALSAFGFGFYSLIRREGVWLLFPCPKQPAGTDAEHVR